MKQHGIVKERRMLITGPDIIEKEKEGPNQGECDMGMKKMVSSLQQNIIELVSQWKQHYKNRMGLNSSLWIIEQEEGE